MADNTTLNSMSGGEVVRDIDRTGVKTQVVTLDLTPSGSETLINGKFPVAGIVDHDAVGTTVYPTLFGGYASAAAPTSVSADGDATRVWMLRNGSLVCNLASSGTLITVTGTSLNTNVTNIAKAEDVASADADVGVPAMAVQKATPANTAGTDGDYEMLQISAGRLWCSSKIDTALPAGTALVGKVGLDQTTVGTTNAVSLAQVGATTVSSNNGTADAGCQRVIIASNNTAFTVNATTAGDVASGASNSGNPVQIGYEAIAHGTNPSAVTAGQRTKSYANRAGIPFVISGHPNIVTIEAATTGAQTDIAIVTVATGLKIVVTQIQVLTDNANTVFPQCRVGFGTANTPTTTGVVLTHPGLPAGGGVSRGDGSGILGIGADDQDLRITNAVPTSGSIRCLVSYYTIES